MVFNSLSYFFILFISLLIYWNTKNKNKFKVIFLISLIFYGFWRVEFILLILFSTIVDYLIALKINEVKPELKRKYLYLSIIINLFILFVFKYLNFFVESIFSFASLFGFSHDPILINIILPLGISFYTFQTISYTVDVYKGIIKPEKSFFDYGSYVIFFPQLIAGPILRASEIIPQFKKISDFKREYFNYGIKRIIFGLFLKVVLADNIAPFVDEGFSISNNSLSAIDVLTLAFMFGFQIYFDFSAYSHIAIGSARLFGINFPENFDFPYLSSSLKEFWKKWHISLSSWIRDYLYLPLTGYQSLRKTKNGIGDEILMKKSTRSLFITWSLMGLWHGANWTFIFWGLYHALNIYIFRKLYIFINNYKNNLKNKYINYLYKINSYAITLLIIMVSWIPFRSQNMEDTIGKFLILSKIKNYTFLGMRENTYIICFIIFISHLLTYYVYKKYSNFYLVNFKKNIFFYFFELIFYTTLLTFIMIYLRPVKQFIYFQF